MKQKLYFSLAIFSFAISVFGQKGSWAYYLDNPIVVDSNSTLIIPTRYSSDFLSINKIASWGDYYANIIFYNFTTDSYKKLFDNDTYIVGFSNRYRFDAKQQKSSTSNLFFYRVKNVDHNRSGRIDNNDPTLLYVSDLHGDNLKPLTTENENVLSIDIFEKQNFALIKIQRDEDKDGDFESTDKDYYYIKLDLATMKFGNKIEIK